MVLVTGKKFETWVDHLCEMHPNVYKHEDKECPPFKDKVDFIEYRREVEEAGNQGFFTDEELEYHAELVE